MKKKLLSKIALVMSVIVFAIEGIAQDRNMKVVMKRKPSLITLMKINL
jgi:hypothetical protein